MSNIAVVYISNRVSFHKMAARSARSLVKHTKRSVDTFLFKPTGTREPEDKFAFLHVEDLKKYESDKFLLSRSVYMLEIYKQLTTKGYESILFLDSDTYVCADIDPLFELFRIFDFFGAHAPARHTTKTVHKVPESFPEINLGVVGMARSRAMEWVLKEQVRLFKENEGLYGNNDQGPMRDALWVMSTTMPLYDEYIEFAMYVLTPEWNFRFNFPTYAKNRVRILHGYSDDMESIARRANGTLGMRVFGRGVK